jgi:hypothetical protein
VLCGVVWCGVVWWAVNNNVTGVAVIPSGFMADTGANAETDLDSGDGEQSQRAYYSFDYVRPANVYWDPEIGQSRAPLLVCNVRPLTHAHCLCGLAAGYAPAASSASSASALSALVMSVLALAAAVAAKF